MDFNPVYNDDKKSPARWVGDFFILGYFYEG